MNSILVGFGSIGRRHLSELATQSNTVAVFDLRNNFPEILAKYNNAKFYSNWESLRSDFTKFDIGVIATWGTTHLEVFRQLIKLSTKTVLIEKPMSSSLHTLNQIQSIAKSEQIRVFENFHYRYSQLKNSINYLEEKYSLGPLLQLNVVGGAKCISTTGIHYLDFCEWLLNERPIEVLANLDGAAINPRSSSLLMYGGVAIWKYSSGFNLTLNFNNKSYADNEIEFVWKNAKARFSDSKLILLSPEDFPYYDSLTTARVKPFKRILEEKEAVLDNLGRDGVSRLYEAIFSETEQYRNPFFGSSTRDLIYALISSDKKRLVSMSEDFPNYEFHDWKIS